MPVPTDPYNFVAGATADAEQVDARFLPLYTALNGALDAENIVAAVREQLGLSDPSSVRRGKCIVATEQSRTNTAYGKLTTPDEVENVVLPTDGLMFVAYQAMWKGSVADAPRAALFLNSNQLVTADNIAGSGYGVQAAALNTQTDYGDRFSTLATFSGGLVGVAEGDDAALPTTGAVVGPGFYSASSGFGAYVEHPSAGLSALVAGEIGGLGGFCTVWAAAGTYDVSVQFKSSSGSVTAKNRKLWVWTLGF